MRWKFELRDIRWWRFIDAKAPKNKRNWVYPRLEGTWEVNEQNQSRDLGKSEWQERQKAKVLSQEKFYFNQKCLIDDLDFAAELLYSETATSKLLA